jgi:predicted dehydrogenase
MIKLGVIGHGGRVSSFIRNCLRPESREEVRVAGIVDPDEAGARSRLDEQDRDVRFYPNLDDLVRRGGVDALMVGTRCNLHADIAIQAAKYDLPLFLEKPVAISMEQAVALERAFDGSRCEVLVSFPLRVSPLCELARTKLAAGAVGTPAHVLAVNYVPYATAYWEVEYRNYAITGGLFLQKATHDLDYLSYLLDSPITRVAATAHYSGMFGGDKPADLRCSACAEQETCLESPQNRRRNGSGGTLTDHRCLFSVACGTPETGTNEDTSSALLEFASGVHGVYTQVFFTRRDAAARGAVVSGYHGTLDFDWYRNDLKHVRHHQPFTDHVKAGSGMSHFGGDAVLGRNFVDMIRGRAKSRAPIQAGLASVYACLAARESARTGAFVKVRQPG